MHRLPPQRRTVGSRGAASRHQAFVQHDHFRGELQPGDPVHDIGLRLAVDDSLTIREAQAMMRATPFPTCIEVEPILQRLVGERIGKGGARSFGARWATGDCTHLSELLGPPSRRCFRRCPTANRRKPATRWTIIAPSPSGHFHRWLPFLRTDGPVVAEIFPQFATTRSAGD